MTNIHYFPRFRMIRDSKGNKYTYAEAYKLWNEGKFYSGNTDWALLLELRGDMDEFDSLCPSLHFRKAA